MKYGIKETEDVIVAAQEVYELYKDVYGDDQAVTTDDLVDLMARGPALVKAVSAAAKNIDQVALELSDIDPEEDEYLIGKYGDLLKNPAYNRIYKGVYYMGTGIASLIQKKEAVAA